jgi:uncharacterized protein YydD (DUF2326 family)
MQISRIYSNNGGIFSPIDFNCGVSANRLNVIYGEVHHPKDQKKDSHNLGKTTLIHLIDFLLLKGMSPDQFLVKHIERFNDFVFYIEIALNTGDFATIRRSAAEPNKIALKRHPEHEVDLSVVPDDAWDHVDMSREDATTLLDGWLDLAVLKPYDYRQAITYFLRTQADYRDELQLAKFAAGKDRHWKPFVAHLFGFNESPIERKYELDESIERLKQKQADRQTTVQFTEDQQPELQARIGVLQQQIDEIEAALDAFSFEPEEHKIMRELVDTIEQEVAEVNDRLYNIRYDVSQIDAALDHKDKFDLAEVTEAFQEAQINFPSGLKKSYEELVAFNKKVTQERNAALRARRKVLTQQQQTLQTRKGDLDKQREAQLSFLRNTDTFEKFKELQKGLSRQRAQFVYLEEQRRLLDQVAETAREVREAERERGRVVDEIKAMVARPTPVFERFSSVFNSYCQRVLNHDGIFFFKVNSSNNFDYQIGLQLLGQAAVTSSLSEGTSYKKLVCALFDLALLKVYEDVSFFHFVYHDGIFEALDDRKKLALLDIIREQIAGKKTQYILTLIDADMPRDADGNKIAFGEDEVILRLHDEGNEGRLFKMPEF